MFIFSIFVIDTVHYQPHDFEEFFNENNIVEIYENSDYLRSKFNEEDLNNFLHSDPKFTVYFSKREHASFFIEAFKSSIVEAGDVIFGENY